MLHDPSHIPHMPMEEEIILSSHEKDILRRLGEKISKIASLPVHREKARLWQRMNNLQQERPMVWINEIPWHEMNVNDYLDCPVVFHTTDFGIVEQVDTVHTDVIGICVCSVFLFIKSKIINLKSQII